MDTGDGYANATSRPETEPEVTKTKTRAESGNSTI